MLSFVINVVLIYLLASRGLCDVTILVMCNVDNIDVCTHVFNSSVPDLISARDVNVTVNAVILNDAGDFMENIRLINLKASENDIGLLLGLGGSDVVNAVACVGEARGIVTMTYVESHLRQHIFGQWAIKLSPDHAGLARALVKVVSSRLMVNAFVLCQDVLNSDGFIQELSRISTGIRFNQTNTVMLSGDTSDLDLHLRLLAAHDGGHRLLIVHTKPGLFERIIRVAKGMSYFESGYAWIVSEEALQADVSRPRSDLPTGLLAIDGYEKDIYSDILHAAINVFVEEVQLLLETIASNLLNETYNPVQYIKQHHNISRVLKRNILTNKHLFNEDGFRIKMKFRLLNSIPIETGNVWKTVGYISDTSVSLGTVVWPGLSIFGPVTNVKESYRVVTRPAEPFLFVSGQVESRLSCPVNTACLSMHVHTPEDIRQAIELYSKGNYNDMFTVFCCEGIVIDILNALSHQIDFDFVVYFHNNTDYGQYRNSKWTGMVGDVISGAADIMAGAVSITSDRANAISFTEPFYFSSFNMVATSNIRYTTLLAFTNPFDMFVWLAIICSATTVAIMTSLFEWNSPFGLNPWGKKRKKNYSLGSGLTMVYSLWFGHTVNTKSPKSWPSKVLQNVWACLAIFMLASYTANLAAFLAGSIYDRRLFSILDNELMSKRIGSIKTTAVDLYTHAVNVELNTRMSRFYVNDINEGLEKIRNGMLDLYMDDSPLLEYALSRQDVNCSIKFAGHTFGDNAYAFGVKKGSWIKAKMDPYILNYVELGFVDNLKWRYVGQNRQCQNKLIEVKDLMFGFPHTKGLFVMLLMAIGISILLLIAENLFYFLVLPSLKRKPSTSLWKSRNVEYFSQRLYKAINSETVKHQAQVLVSKMKKRKFSFKNKIRRQTNTVPANLKSYVSRTDYPAEGCFYNGHIKSNSDTQLDTCKINQISGSGDGIFTICENCSDNVTFGERFSGDDYECANLSDIDNILCAIQASGNHDCFQNPVFESDTDDDDVRATTIDVHTVKRGRMSIMAACNSPYLNDGCVKSKTKTSTDSSKSGSKKYETWPSPKTRRRSLKKVSVGNDQCEATNRKSDNTLNGNLIVNELSVGYRKTCRACSFSVSPSYLQSSSQYELKDNRIKSSLRQSAMATMPRRPSMSVDENAVEVLSKEDLLILWKRSEIELQTKLNRMLQQNNHLRSLVDIAESNESICEKDRKHIISVRL